MIAENDLDAEILARSVINLLNNNDRLKSMRDACESLFQPRSTELLVDEMMDLLKAKNKL
jgi:UDP-N-acetylglucosamine:LPS N-acetylglucosamine transferase